MGKHRLNRNNKTIFESIVLLSAIFHGLQILAFSTPPLEEELKINVKYLKPIFLYMQKKNDIDSSSLLENLFKQSSDTVSLSVFDRSYNDIMQCISHAVPYIKDEDTKDGWQAFFAALYFLNSVKRALRFIKIHDGDITKKLNYISQKIDHFLYCLYEELEVDNTTRSLNSDTVGFGIRQILISNIIPGLEDVFDKSCTIESNIDVLQSDVNGVNMHNSSIDSKLDVIDVELNNIQNDIDTILSKVCTIDSKIDIVDDNSIIMLSLIDNLDQDFLSIESNIDIVDDALHSIDSKIDKLDLKTDTLESKVCAVDSKVEVMALLTKSDSIDIIESKVCVTASKLSELDTQVIGVESDLDQIIFDLGEIKSLILTLTNC